MLLSVLLRLVAEIHTLMFTWPVSTECSGCK